MKYIDLHVHSDASDGTFTPTQVIEYAEEKSLYAIALTDHDTVSGISEAMSACKGKNVKLIPGVELSTEYNSKDVHMLGLFIDYKSTKLIHHLNNFNNLREDRNKKMCDLMREDGINISSEMLKNTFKGAVLTRAHFARYLLDNGYVSTMDEAFKTYLNEKCKYYVPKVKISPFEAIRIIKEASGIPIIAHPVLYHFDDQQLDDLVRDFKSNGLEGIEAIYTLNSPQYEEKLINLAKKYDLFISGGSDFHGSNKPLTDLGTGKGNLQIPQTLLEQFGRF